MAAGYDVLGVAMESAGMDEDKPRLPRLQFAVEHPAERKDYLLFDDGGVPDPDEMQFNDGERGRLFPRKLASQTYMIQDQRYLQCYANMFCKFIDLYAE